MSHAARISASVVNNRVRALVDPVKLIMLHEDDDKNAFLSYTQQKQIDAVEQLYDEGVLTPELIEGLTDNTELDLWRTYRPERPFLP